MSQKEALAEVEAKYGGLEELVLHLLTEAPEVLDLGEGEPLGLPAKAERAELSLETTAFVLNRSPQFRALLRSDIVNQVFTLEAERKHIQKVTEIAKGDDRIVASPRGGTVQVSQVASDVIKAGDYLNKYRGSPLDEGKGGPMLPFQINFIGREEVQVTQLGGGSGADRPIEAHFTAQPEAESAGYQPQSAGDLPPEAARRHYRKTSGGAFDDLDAEDGYPLDLYGSEAAEKARDREIAEKKARDGHPTEPSGDFREGRVAVNGRKSVQLAD